jgi:hypothetical protein
MKRITLILTFMLAVLTLNAQITRVAVKPADLPKTITDNVTKAYAGYTVKGATKITENKVVTFDVIITKGTASETLVYDKDGKFLRKVAPKTATISKTGQKPADKPAPAKK